MKCKVVRVRWQKGIERINISPNDTVNTIIEKMATNHKFDGKKAILIQESTNAVTTRPTKLSQLKLENGEMFRLELDKDNNSKELQRALSEPANKDEDQIPQSIKRFKNEWGKNAVSVAEITGKHIIIDVQETTLIKKILLPSADCTRISHIACELHFETPRIFLLYGTRPSDSVIRVHSVSFPSQYAKDGEIIFDESQKSASDSLATKLGLMFLGVIFINAKKQPPISPKYIKFLGCLAQSVGEHFTVVASLPDAGLCHFEAFQFSTQFLKELKNGLFICDSGESSLKMKTQNVVHTKTTDEVDVSYFLVNVAISTRDSWFPRARFPYQGFYPTVVDFAEALKTDFEVPNFVRFLDFNMLLFLETWFNSNNEIPMMAKTCIGKREFPFAIQSRIDEIIEAAALLND